MKQLPIFVNLSGKPVILLGDGEMAEAKRRLIERAGGSCVGEGDVDARIAFVALEDDRDALAAVQRLRVRGLLVNAVDRPALCDFTTPAVVDRDPVLVAIGTGGASAGLAKALRQRLEGILPARLGQLATLLDEAREAIRARWSAGPERRRAIDAALSAGGALDPLVEQSDQAVAAWLDHGGEGLGAATYELVVGSPDPDDLSLRQVRLLGSADLVLHPENMPMPILARARADAAMQIDNGEIDTADRGVVVRLIWSATAESS